MTNFAAWVVPLGALVASVACAALAFAGRARWAPAAALCGLAVSCCAAICLLLRGAPETAQRVIGFRWIELGQFQIDLALQLDGLSLAMIAMVTLVSLMVAWYSVGYLRSDPGIARYFAVFCGFVFCMVMLVLSSNLLTLYFFWEGVGLCSYLLIGFWFRRPKAARAATKAFLVNRVADCGFLLGILLLWNLVAGTQGAPIVLGHLDFDLIFSACETISHQQPALLGLIGFLLVLGAIGKSAQFPLHVWLPDAMEGPTPVSALIHAATMVTAGVYLLARMAPLLVLTPQALALAGWLGGITALMAGWIALHQHDLKRVLAYSTVSQLGYMFLALGTGAHDGMISAAVTGAIFHLLTHAFFKALLFLSAGNVMHAMGDVIDMRRFGGLKSVLPKTNLAFAVGAAALAGLPPLAGFWSKDGILQLLWKAGEHSFAHQIQFGIALATAFLTALYSFRAYAKTFLGRTHFPVEAGEHPHEAGNTMLIPMAILAIGSVFVGAALGPTHALGHYTRHVLERLGENALQENLLMMAISTVVAIAGIFIAWHWSTRSQTEPVSILSRLGSKEFYLNELFQNLIVRPLILVATWVAWLDRNMVDTLSIRLASLPQTVGFFGRRLQNGVIGTYSFVAFIGLVAVLWFVLTR